MQKCESRTKRVMSAIIAGMMALQVVAPTISYADDTVASTASSEDNSDAQVDPGVPVQTDTASSNTATEPDSGEGLIQNDTVSDSQGNETDTQEETVQDTVQQNDSGSESESVRTVTVTLNKNGGIFEPEWLETANENPIAAYLGTETDDIAVEDTGDTIVATVTDRDSISIPVALSSNDSLYFTGWDVSSGSYDADNEMLTFDDGVDAYVLTAVFMKCVHLILIISLTSLLMDLHSHQMTDLYRHLLHLMTATILSLHTVQTVVQAKVNTKAIARRGAAVNPREPFI